MKTPIDIKIRSERATNIPIAEKPETLNIDATGYIQKTKTGYRLVYTESDSDGTEVETTINAIGSTVSISKDGGVKSTMVFEQGMRHNCIYDTGFFPMQLAVRTKELHNTIEGTSGKLDIKYTVEIVGNLAETCKLSYSVSPQKKLLS